MLVQSHVSVPPAAASRIWLVSGLIQVAWLQRTAFICTVIGLRQHSSLSSTPAAGAACHQRLSGHIRVTAPDCAAVAALT